MNKFFLISLVSVLFFIPFVNIHAQVANIAITQPALNESWKTGETRTITWSSPEFFAPTTVAISLIPKPPECLTTIPPCAIASVAPYVVTADAPNTGQYSWAIPNDLSSSFLGKVYLVIAITNTSYLDFSEQFTITKDTPVNQIALTHPVGGESYSNSTQQAITWTGGSGAVTIQLKPYIVCITFPCESGTSYTIASNINNTGNYIWNVAKDAYSQDIPPGSYIMHIFDSNGMTSKTATPITIQTPSPELCYGLDGHNVKYSNSPTVYYIDDCKKQIYSSPVVFFSWNDSFDGVVTLQPYEVFPDDGFVKLPTGIVIKGSGPTVYYIDGVSRRPFTSAAAFFDAGFVFADILPFSDFDVNVHPLGDPIF